MKSTTKLTSKGQVVIPKAIRERLRWRAGARLEVEALPDGRLLLYPAYLEAIERASGCLRSLPGDPLAELETEHRAEVEADERRRRHR